MTAHSIGLRARLASLVSLGIAFRDMGFRAIGVRLRARLQVGSEVAERSGRKEIGHVE